jgi:hypothetical protein
MELVNLPTTKEQFEKFVTSINRGRPFGDENWVISTAARSGLDFTLRTRGRQRKVVEGEIGECPLFLAEGDPQVFLLSDEGQHLVLDPAVVLARANVLSNEIAAVFRITGEGVRISGGTIDGTTTTFPATDGRDGVLVSGGVTSTPLKNVSIIDVKIRDVGYRGIEALSVDDFDALFTTVTRPYADGFFCVARQTKPRPNFVGLDHSYNLVDQRTAINEASSLGGGAVDIRGVQDGNDAADDARAWLTRSIGNHSIMPTLGSGSGGQLAYEYYGGVEHIAVVGSVAAGGRTAYSFDFVNYGVVFGCTGADMGIRGVEHAGAIATVGFGNALRAAKVTPAVDGETTRRTRGVALSAKDRIFKKDTPDEFTEFYLTSILAVGASAYDAFANRGAQLQDSSIVALTGTAFRRDYPALVGVDTDDPTPVSYGVEVFKQQASQNLLLHTLTGLAFDQGPVPVTNPDFNGVVEHALRTANASGTSMFGCALIGGSSSAVEVTQGGESEIATVTVAGIAPGAFPSGTFRPYRAAGVMSGVRLFGCPGEPDALDRQPQLSDSVVVIVGSGVPSDTGNPAGNASVYLRTDGTSTDPRLFVRANNGTPDWSSRVP